MAALNLLPASLTCLGGAGVVQLKSMSQAPFHGRAGGAEGQP